MIKRHWKESSIPRFHKTSTALPILFQQTPRHHEFNGSSTRVPETRDQAHCLASITQLKCQFSTFFRLQNRRFPRTWSMYLWTLVSSGSKFTNDTKRRSQLKSRGIFSVIKFRRWPQLKTWECTSSWMRKIPLPRLLQEARCDLAR